MYLQAKMSPQSLHLNKSHKDKVFTQHCLLFIIPVHIICTNIINNKQSYVETSLS